MKNLFETYCSNKKTNQLVSNTSWITLLIIEILIIGYYLFWKRSFNYDEFESIHAGWKILTGEIIYEEFHEIHHPMLYYLLACIIRIFGNTLVSIYVSCFFIFLLSVGTIFYTYRLAEHIFDRDTAIVSSILLPLIPWFTLSAFEVRPDVPMLLFGIASIYYLYQFIDNSKHLSLYISALCLGLSFLFLQKAVFFIAMIAGILIHRFYKKEITLKDISIYAILITAVYGIFLIFLSINTSLESYFFFCFKFVQARSEHIGHIGKFELILDEVLHLDRLIWIIIPAFATILTFCRLTRQQWEIVIGALWLLLTVVIVATPSDHYYLPAMVLFSIIISYGFVIVAKRYLSKWITILLLIVVISGSFNYYNLAPKNAQDREHQLTRIDYVLSHTNEDDYVYDGSILFNLYRKDLDFFWLRGHAEIPAHETYALLKPYNYDIYRAINEKNPKIISYRHINLTKAPWILERYRKSSEFDDLYIKYNNHTGFTFWSTFVDDLNVGSSIKPSWNFFTPAGDIEVNMQKAADQTLDETAKLSYPYVGIGMRFNDSGNPVDLTNAENIVLSYQLSGPVSLLLKQRGIKTGEEYRIELPPAKDYMEIILNWKDFYQPSWVNNQQNIDLSIITGIKFQIASPLQTDAELGIRNIEFTGFEFE